MNNDKKEDNSRCCWWCGKPITDQNPQFYEMEVCEDEKCKWEWYYACRNERKMNKNNLY